MRNSIPARAIVLLLIGTAAGCHGLILKKEDKAHVKAAKVAGRAVQGAATMWLSEAYYAGRRSRQ
jgi:hypothetical protein